MSLQFNGCTSSPRHNKSPKMYSKPLDTDICPKARQSMPTPNVRSSCLKVTSCTKGPLSEPPDCTWNDPVLDTGRPYKRSMGPKLIWPNIEIVINVIFEEILVLQRVMHIIKSTGGSHLSRTAVKLDSHLAWIFVAKFLCIIKLIIIIG